MDQESRNKLLNIKPHLELDKDLKIQELEKENAYLTIQLNKYKKQLSTINPKKHTSQDFSKKLKEVRAKHTEHVAQISKAKDKWREKMNKALKEVEFLKKIIKTKFGKDAYIEVVNHVDNPDRGSLFRNEESKKRFYDASCG